MPMFQNMGAFFLGTLVPSEQKFLKPLIENARKNGYTKFVEPCSGAFAMSHLAVQAGFKPSQIEASDVSMFTSIMGLAIMRETTASLELHAKGFSDEELLDPATALYAWKYLNLSMKGGKEYFYNMLLDFQYQREKYVKEIDDQLNRARDILNGMNYRPLDMWKHMEEIIDDPHCLVIANPPTYTAGFEKYYDTGGAMTWTEPEYGIFNPETGLKEFMDMCENAKCLVMCYEENEPNKTAGYPVFARYGVRDGINVYLTTNRPDEATALAEGRKIARPNEGKLEPIDCSILPRDYEFTEKTKIEVRRIEAFQAAYYRRLWTHNFVGSNAKMNYGMFVDGYIAGVFGMDASALTMGAFGTRVSDSMFLMYGMTIPHKVYRLGRLVTMLAQNREFVLSQLNDIEKEKVQSVKTVQMTKYPEAKEMRGVMKLIERHQDPKSGFRLTYVSELKDRDEKQTLSEWLRREQKWQKERAKSKQATK